MHITVCIEGETARTQEELTHQQVVAVLNEKGSKLIEYQLLLGYQE